MNIDEIKRSLNKRRTNFSPAPQYPTVPATPAPSPVRATLSPKRTTVRTGVSTVNEIFTKTLEEEEKEPQSETWYAPEDGFSALDLDDVRRTISDLGLDEEEYDWRPQTSKGRKSRREFTNFLKISL